MKKMILPLICVALLLSSCAAPTNTQTSGNHHKPSDKKVLIGVADNAHKMSSQLIASQKINSNPLVATLVKKALTDPTNTEPLYGLGYLHMENGITSKDARELELAEAYLKEVLTQFPGNESVLQALYNVYYDNTLRSRSSSAFDQAKQVFLQIPESSRIKLNSPSLAKFAATAFQQEQKRQPDRQALREILLTAIQESPQTESSYIQLAKLYSEDRYFPLAIATLKLGAESNNSSAELFKTIADTYTKRSEINGCSYENTTDIQNAGKYYQMAIPFRPEDQELHTSLSQTFFDQNYSHLGLHEAQIALDIKPTKENIGFKAQYLSSLGYHNQALVLLQNAMSLGYNPSDAGYHEIFMNQGDWKKAAEGFDAYIKSREKISVYDVIKSDIIAQQAKIQPWPLTKKISINSTWEQNLLNYWQTHTNDDELKKTALTRCEKTEYFFYSGYQDMQARKITQANTKFKAAIAQNTYRFIERPLARYFLQKN